MELSRKALAVAPSATLEIDNRAKALRASGVRVIGFGVGEPDFDTPSFIRDAAKKAMDEGKTRYTPVAGTLSLRKAIAAKLARENHAQYAVNQIIVSSGAKHSLYNAFQAILNPGDEVIIPSPCWVSYPEMVKLADGIPVTVETHEEDGFAVAPAAIRAAVTPRTKAILICNPCNPTGALMGRELLAEIADIAEKFDLFVISDEIYEKLVYNSEDYVSFVSLGEKAQRRTILINGASKAYAMTGWRIGYAACPPEVASVISNLQSQETSASNTIAQYATEAALNGPTEELVMMQKAFAARRIAMCDAINAIPGLSCRLPGGAFYVLMNITGIIGKKYHGTEITGSESFASLLLDHARVALVPGRAFGTDKHVRLSYAVDIGTIREGIAKIAAFVSELE